MRRQMITVAGHRSECIDEKKALAQAKRNLEMAQQKVQLCRQWSVKAHRAADEYNAQLGRAEQALNQGVPQMLALMERIIIALEGYVSSMGRPSAASEANESATDQAAQPATEAAPAPQAAETRSPESESSEPHPVGAVEVAAAVSPEETRPTP